MKTESSKKNNGYVNRDPFFIVPKMLYFLLNWLVYSPHSFIFQFTKGVWGLSSEEINLSFFFQVFNFIGAMFWGYWADKTRKYKLIAAGCVAINTAFVVAMAFPVFESHSAKLWYYFALTAGQCFFSAGTFPMIDAIVLSILEADPSAGKDYYGSQKAFGTVSHNVTTWFIHKFYEMNGQDFLVMYYSAVATMVALVCAILYGVSDNLKIKAHKHHGPAKKATELDEQVAPEGNSITGLITNGSFFIFLLSILAAGIVRSVNTINHSVYLTDYLKLDKSVLGNLMIIGRMIPELALLFYAKSIMVKVGPHWFMILGQAAGVVRILLYLLLKPFESGHGLYFGILVIIEMLKGVNSSLVSAGAFRIASDLAPPAWSGSAQTLVGGFWQGISMAVAAIISKLILAYMGDGDDGLYYVFGFTGTLGLISLLFIFFHYAVTDKKLFSKSE